MYVIVEVPAETPVTTPVEVTVATAVLDEDHVPPVVADANCEFEPSHTEDAPVIAETIGRAFTVTLLTAEPEQDPE